MAVYFSNNLNLFKKSLVPRITGIINTFSALIDSARTLSRLSSEYIKSLKNSLRCWTIFSCSIIYFYFLLTKVSFLVSCVCLCMLTYNMQNEAGNSSFLWIMRKTMYDVRGLLLNTYELCNFNSTFQKLQSYIFLI